MSGEEIRDGGEELKGRIDRKGLIGWRWKRGLIDWSWRRELIGED